MMGHFYIGGNWIQYDAIHNFFVWLRTGSNPTDNNQFQRNIGKSFQILIRHT